MDRSSLGRFVAIATLFSLVLYLPGITTLAATPGASLSGRVSMREGAAVRGAVVKLADTKTQSVYESAGSDAAGQFALESLPAGTYTMGIQTPEGFYLIETPLTLAPGETRSLALALRPSAPPEGQEPETAQGPADTKKKRKGGILASPLFATGVLLGTAIIVGLAVSSKHHETASPSNP